MFFFRLGGVFLSKIPLKCVIQLLRISAVALEIPLIYHFPILQRQKVNGLNDVAKAIGRLDIEPDQNMTDELGAVKMSLIPIRLPEECQKQASVIIAILASVVVHRLKTALNPRVVLVADLGPQDHRACIIKPLEGSAVLGFAHKAAHKRIVRTKSAKGIQLVHGFVQTDRRVIVLCPRDKLERSRKHGIGLA